MPKNNLFLILALGMILLGACKEDHHIKVEKDGSAAVSYDLHFVDSDTARNNASDTTDLTAAKDSLYRIFNTFYASPLISNYECKIDNDLNVAVTYKINDVNQLGKFLSPFLGVPVTCKHSRRTFTLDAGTGNADPEDDIGGHTNMMAFSLTVELPGKIKKIENSSGLPAIYSGNQFTIESNLGMLNYSGKRNLISIKY